MSRRLKFITKSTCTSNWRHVPSELNPADVLSRGCRSDKLMKTKSWLSGPEFLSESPDSWPCRFAETTLDVENVKAFDKKAASAFLITEIIDPVDKLIAYFSSWFKLKKATAWLLKFKTFLINSNSVYHFSRSLSVSDLRKAEIELIKYEQWNCFGDIMLKMQTNENFSLPSKSPLLKLNPVIVNGLLRVGGRLDRASVSFDLKHPIILPHTSHLTNLIVLHCHCITGHGGANMTLNQLLQRYWILRSTAVVRRVLNSCMHCRRRYEKPGAQKMADLPPSRLQIDTHPFAYCGVDYFGPLLVKQRRSQVKRYGCLFICLTSRAIHIEVAMDLTTDAFINALRRFLSRRGPVLHFFSDNGTNFVSAEKTLREALRQWNQHQIEDFLLQKEIQWTFNPPNASHMGGAWERMIRSVRRILTALMTERILDDDQLHTFLLEAESILNSRPLTLITTDVDGLEPLTPNHLLKLCPTGNFPPSLPSDEHCCPKRRWKNVQYLADQFWKRWSREYLKTIIARQKWFKKKTNFQKDDVVLLVDDSIPRSQWRLGKVLKLFPDEQGLVRQVVVKTRGSEVRRPVHKLCLVVPANLDVMPRKNSGDPAITVK